MLPVLRKLPSPNDLYIFGASKSPTLCSFSVFDALAKVPSGLLEGNWLWLGEYDLCTSISVPDADNGVLEGKYCRTTFQEVLTFLNQYFV